MIEPNSVPVAVAPSIATRPTRRATFQQLTRAADRGRDFQAKLLADPAIAVTASAPLESKVGGPLLAERVQNVTIEAAGGRRHLINQDLLYRVPDGAVAAFKNGFFREAERVGPRMKVVAVERDGRWVPGDGTALTDSVRSADCACAPLPQLAPFADPSVGRFIVEASGAQIGTDLPGVAPATAYLCVDQRSLVETKRECAFTITFLNPWNQNGLFPPYVDSFGRYGIKDHGDGTATVTAYWVGDAGSQLLEPTLRETSLGKALKTTWDSTAHAFDRVPLFGGLARSMANATEAAALAAGKAATALGDAALGASGATEGLFPLAALQHVRFYERDWCNPERWGQSDAERRGGEVELRAQPRRARALPVETDAAYAARAWRALRGPQQSSAADGFDRDPPRAPIGFGGSRGGPEVAASGAVPAGPGARFRLARW